jgi:ankyrin repeat protein
LLREHVFNQLRSHPALARERYKHWRTMLHDASGDADVALVERLLEIGVPRSSCNERAPSPLYCLANECSAPEASRIVHALLRNEPESLNAPWGVKRCTPLHMAARRGNADVIQALLDEGAEIEFRDSAGETPLRRAVNCNKVEAARLLLARGANPDSEDSKGLSVSRAARSTQMKQLFAPPSSISV